MKEENSSTLTLPPDLSLIAAAPLASEFLALRGRPITVDAAQVERLGAQCAQVLLSATETWMSDGVGFSLINPSAAFLDAIEILGIPAARLGE